MEAKAEYLALFSEEAEDLLREWEASMLALESDPRDREALSALFRAIHTLKGSAGFVGFDALQKLAHGLESALADVRDGARPFAEGIGQVLFEGFDTCRSMVEAAGRGAPHEVDAAALLARLERWQRQGQAAGTAPDAAPGSAPASAPPSPCRLAVRIDGQPREAYLRSFLVKARLERLGRILAVDPSPEKLRDGRDPFSYVVTLQTARPPEGLAAEVSVDQVAVSLWKEAAAPVAVPVPAARGAGEQASPAARSEEAVPRLDEVVRVSVQKLDDLLNLVGELVIHNSGFESAARQLAEQFGKGKVEPGLDGLVSALEEKTEALAVITKSLQDGIMKARMLPIGSVFARFRRVVRDLSRASGKEVALELFGEETEIDKKVIDRIGEPLVHLVRNAVDHGLEPASEREARGKPAAGTVRLGASQQGDHICIEVTDDGRGLDREAILRKAVEKGLVSAAEAAGAGAERVLEFIFLPGFSTAAAVSDVSGRGVGMDAVRRAVEDMSGSLRVRSTPGAGTTVTISLPLTMAIITAVLVEVGSSIYAVPMSAVREILKPRGAMLSTVGTRRVVLLRDEVLSLVSLGEALAGRLDPGARGSCPRPAAEGSPVVIVDFEDRKIGLEVGRILGTREVVIKSLSRHYREVEGLIGASILGDGRIALIVDVEALVRALDVGGGANGGANHGANGNGDGSGNGSGASSARDALLQSVQIDDPGQTPGSLPGPDHAAAVEVNPARLLQGEGGRLLDAVNSAGAVQASMALTELTGSEIRVSFPESRLVPLGDVASAMGGEETAVGGVYVAVKGDLAAGFLLVACEASLLALDDLLHGRQRGTARGLAEVDLSALSEMGNILASCFLGAIADTAGLAVSPEVPEVSIDMCQSVVDSILARFNSPGDRILLTEAVVYGRDGRDVVCHQVLFLEPGSLARLLDALAAGAPGLPETAAAARAGS
jgi:two-component system chemotaxis sensor kinase CheA